MEDKIQRWSKPEKEILCKVIPEEPMLPYPTHRETLPNGEVAIVYDIPMEDKNKVLAELYPFNNLPKFSKTMLCIHQHKNFKVRDYLVIRENKRNLIVSPYYAISGGTVIDWVEPEEMDKE